MKASNGKSGGKLLDSPERRIQGLTLYFNLIYISNSFPFFVFRSEMNNNEVNLPGSSEGAFE